MKNEVAEIKLWIGELGILQNAIKELEQKKQVTVSYEPVACGLMELISSNE